MFRTLSPASIQELDQLSRELKSKRAELAPYKNEAREIDFLLEKKKKKLEALDRSEFIGCLPAVSICLLITWAAFTLAGEPPAFNTGWIIFVWYPGIFILCAGLNEFLNWGPVRHFITLGQIPRRKERLQNEIDELQSQKAIHPALKLEHETYSQVSKISLILIGALSKHKDQYIFHRRSDSADFSRDLDEYGALISLAENRCKDLDILRSEISFHRSYYLHRRAGRPRVTKFISKGRDREPWERASSEQWGGIRDLKPVTPPPNIPSNSDKPSLGTRIDGPAEDSDETSRAIGEKLPSADELNYDGSTSEGNVGSVSGRKEKTPGLRDLSLFDDIPIDQEVKGNKQVDRVTEVIPPERRFQRKARIIDWESVIRQRKQTGLVGEEIVVLLEQQYLSECGRSDLAAMVQHVSAVEGDGLGYDIRSFFQDGRMKYIEVKSTSKSVETPFQLSRGEHNLIVLHPESCFIYRISLLQIPPELWIISGTSLLEHSDFTPTQFLVQFNGSAELTPN